MTTSRAFLVTLKTLGIACAVVLGLALCFLAVLGMAFVLGIPAF